MGRRAGLYEPRRSSPGDADVPDGPSLDSAQVDDPQGLIRSGAGGLVL